MGVSAAIIAGFDAAKALFTFLATPQGQAVVSDWRNNTAAWEATTKKAGDWIEGLLK